ncbi:MAG: radical SAM protein [Nitrospiraceae bacterium]|nr:MAG: radical SAM protein [Nitrospiraceae bacterium]
MKNKKILLVNLPFEKIYEKTSLKGVAPSTPPLGLACIGGSLLQNGHEVKLFDFNIYGTGEFVKILEDFAPDFVGITFVTPLIREAQKVSELVKKINRKIIVIGGGPHCSSFPESSVKEALLDIGVIGEGDFIINEIASGKDLQQIKGIAYKKGDEIITNEREDFIKDLDSLPFPAYPLYEKEKYKVPAAIARENPVAWVETSRGCVFGCIYCNKSCFGKTFRVKSPERIVEEFAEVKKLGFREIHLTDDGFTTNIKRAKRICDLLIESKVNIGWSTITGIRVDRVDFELLGKMRQAGCYRVYFGIESGNQEILNNIKKGITLEQVRKAVESAKKAKLEVAGYFMIGLPGETEKTMQDTIRFAKLLDLDLAKISITIPLPATEIFNELDTKGLIKTHDWEKFKFYSTPSTIYDHQNLSWPTIEKYYAKFYKEIYLNPKFILRRFKNGLVNKTLIDDFKMFIQMKWT